MKGAMPGAYAVVIWKSRIIGKELIYDIPERYAEAESSELTAEVAIDGLNEFALNLTADVPDE
jgi:hypothetical protein